MYADVGKVTANDIIEQFGHPDVIWASPDCTTYSIAAISHHRRIDENGNLYPISDYAKFCDEVNQHVLELIKELSPKYYFIENPRGAMRKMKWMQELPRYTITYCKYGDKRMKPTDIWTNHPNPKFKPACHNGDTCHVAAPRGARTGTQGLNGSIERSKIPEEFCRHIVDICEEENA
jgi:site-specific DNA-cytosine methylase